LEARENDIEQLILAFARPSSVAPEVVQLLRRITWSGNLSELRGAVGRLKAVADGDHIDSRDLSLELRWRAVARKLSRIERVQIREILAALDECDGNRQLAATTLGMSRSTLYRKLRSAGIDLDNATY
jgi:transcriptional regulator of acetoin/glycerol metabolism